MAIMGSGGIKRETDAASPITRHSEGFQPQNVNKPITGGGSSLPRQNNLSNANKLKNAKSIAKPSGNTGGSNNPIKNAIQRKNPNNNYTRPNSARGGNAAGGTGGEGTPGAGQNGAGSTGNSLMDKNPLTRKQDGKGNIGGRATTDPNNPDDEEKSEGEQLREKFWMRVKQFLMRHPVVIFYALLVLAVLAIFYIVISAIIAILSGGAAVEVGVTESEKNYGDFFAFEQAEIYLLDENGTAAIGSHTISLSDYVKGVVYANTMNIDLSGLSSEQMKEFYKAVIVTVKAEIMSRGRYNNKTKSMQLKVTDFNYCDPSYGCKEVSKSGKRFFLSNGIEYKTDSVIKSYDSLEDKYLIIMNTAYSETLNQVVTPSSVNVPLTEYTWSPPSSSSSLFSSWASNAKNGTTAANLIAGSFTGYKIYKLSDYAMQFESVFSSQYSYWWPIGSATADANGLYSDDPTSTTITTKYGPSFGSQTINKGITISGVCNSTKVIAIGDGTVSFVGTNTKYGKYVIVKHDDNLQSLYGSLANVSVSQGSKISVGQLIGTVGRINTTDACGLYFEVYKNGVNVNPEDYVSAASPRTSKANYIKFSQGTDNKQTVCKTLLASGFNKNAVAGLMANIERESGFRLNALSDGGTSNGLFQWHKGRLERLKQYCGAEYLTSIKCQLDYFLYEITEGTEKNDGAYEYLMGSHSAYDMGYQFCLKFERPAGGASSAAKRGELARDKYTSYVNSGCQ